ncbi:MAG: YkgJ family cysteine cluster protein [Theionarchaea archaeon]|nr:YkgJ family cysteine cluster protein [Theionarchaea archaeon]MBU7037873.1 YkgJ family cysteine cluster protein [Theionarchaea archaeon]
MKEVLSPFEDHRFECVMCGECCCSRSIPLTCEDIKRISRYRDPKDFVVIFGERKLVLDRREWDSGCVFLRDGMCTIQEDKPLVCRLYPICVSDYPLTKEEGKNIELDDGSSAFVYVDVSCKGVGRGKLVDLEEIRRDALVLRNEVFATDLEALIGWYIDYEEEEPEEKESD